MSEIEVKITTSNGGGIQNSNKKSRKNKTPVFRQQRRPSSGGEENSGNGSPKNSIDQRASSSPESPISVPNLPTSEAEKRTSAAAMLFNEPPLPPPPGGIKSYSDFMRSLAAKYNNNENGLPSNNDSPFQPFKAASNPLPPPPPPPSSVANTPVHPLLGLPSPFPFLASGLSGLADPKAKGHLPPGLPPGFPNMMDMHSTQALLNLARSGNFLGQPPVTSAPSHNSSAFSPSLSSEASKKRPLAPSEALDLSPPTSVNKKAKIEVRNLPLNNQTTTSPVASAADPTILNWSVSEVSNFVSSIDICRDYAEVFRDHNIDGSALPLLTEDHLTLRLGLKLGPALKLRSIIAKKLGPAHADICVHCSHCNSKMADREETHLNNGISNNAQVSADLNHERSASRNSNLSEK